MPSPADPAPQLEALAGFPRPASHRCACGSDQHRPGSCEYARRAVAEHLARQPKAACSYEGCTEASVRTCDACDAPRCGEHLRETVAYGLETTACVGGCEA